MSRTTFYQVAYVGWPPVHHTQFNNPNSVYWQERCKALIARFDARAPECIAETEWAWLNATIAAHLGEEATWLAYYDTYTLALEAMQPGVTVQAIAYAAGVLPEGPEKNEGEQ